ncbi:MAG: lysophospholipid acyltransferase family protein [Kiloniellaceae bacterium]
MAASSLGSPLRAVSCISLYAGFTLPLMPVQAVAVTFNLPLQRLLPLWYHRQCCRILGFQVDRRGRQTQNHPTLYVSNHVSYFDIMVLGSLIKGSFVAKADVAGWPLFGWLAKLQRSVFVERRGLKIADQRDEMAVRLGRGDDLILFPEGTSSDGNRVRPFKSALFSVAKRRVNGKPLPVQPVSIAYTRLDGMPMGRYLRPFVAWYGDMDLANHIWHAAGLGWVTVVVEFHPPATIEEKGSRKALSEYCYDRVAGGVAAALAGRPQARPERRTAAAVS